MYLIYEHFKETAECAFMEEKKLIWNSAKLPRNTEQHILGLHFIVYILWVKWLTLIYVNKFLL